MLTAALLSCALVLTAAGYPPEATRKSPPAGIEGRALERGDDFPAMAMAGTTGPVALEKGRRHILIFYRGAW
jgi:hypothetical protein